MKEKSKPVVVHGYMNAFGLPEEKVTSYATETDGLNAIKSSMMSWISMALRENQDIIYFETQGEWRYAKIILDFAGQAYTVVNRLEPERRSRRR